MRFDRIGGARDSNAPHVYTLDPSLAQVSMPTGVQILGPGPTGVQFDIANGARFNVTIAFVDLAGNAPFVLQGEMLVGADCCMLRDFLTCSALHSVQCCVACDSVAGLQFGHRRSHAQPDDLLPRSSEWRVSAMRLRTLSCASQVGF